MALGLLSEICGLTQKNSHKTSLESHRAERMQENPSSKNEKTL